MAPPSPKTAAGASEATEEPKRRAKRKSRLERQARRAKGSDDPPVASGSSTPLDAAAPDGELHILGASKSQTGGTESQTALAARTFAEGDDFIAFAFSDPEEGHGAATAGSKKKTDRKGKGKDTGGDDDPLGELIVTEIAPGRAPEREREAKEKLSRAARRERDRDNEVNGDERNDRRNEREAGRKRKHDEYDDGYANKKERVDAASRKSPWVDALELDKCRNVAEMMHKEVESFVDWISPTPVEDEVRGLIVTHISKVVTAAFSDAVVYPFGSFQTKLYLPLGDIDLVILSDSMAYSDTPTVLHVLANTLKRSGITSYVTIIAKAKVPIVKFVTTHGRFKVDISINQANGLVAGQMITGFLKNMIPNAEGTESKALRSLIMVTKAFLNQRSMNEVYTGGLGSYAIVCLAVSFLQMHPKVRTGEIDPEKNLGVLIMEFFELYGHHFNYDEVGISLREGGTYFNKRQRGWHAEYKRNMLSIEDPADPSNDISSGSYNFHKVRTAFAGCHGILTSTAYLRAGILSSRRHGQSVRLRSHYEPEDMSILATVMGITQETINHRKLVQELYDKQVMHRLAGVKPLPVVVDDANVRKSEQKVSSASSKQKASHAVEKEWNGKGADRDSDNEDNYRDRQHRQPADDEGGRYAIERQPPKKRRKTGRATDSHAVYFVGDDEDDTEGAINLDDEEYMSDESAEERPSRPDSSKNDNKRSYWLSKGIGMEASVEDESS